MDGFEQEAAATLETTTCPVCGAVAEVTDRSVLESTDGPVEHARVTCLARHWFVLPLSSLTTTSGAGAPGARLAPGVTPPGR
ncbi:hypothetical protein [Terrabacter sp. NPDC000476]|uniref:hypothetical protein n=1 Tax=Terrabacter sp. NPDC000476 TaxID=3154258 RepID=UPI00331F22AA